jgi:hypothetical protein
MIKLFFLLVTALKFSMQIAEVLGQWKRTKNQFEGQ